MTNGQQLNDKWLRIKDYLKRKYKIMDEKDTMLVFSFAFNGDGGERSQIVFVNYDESDSGTGWVQVISRCGIIVPSRVQAALEFVGEHICGGMVKIGENFFIKQTVPLDGLTSNQLELFIGITIALADDVEKKFVGGDKN